MTVNEYQKLTMVTLNPDLSKRDVLINGVMGLCGEAGEAIDLVKKHLAQGHELDREALSKNWGMWPGIWRKPPLPWMWNWRKFSFKNIEKLKRRYPEVCGRALYPTLRNMKNGCATKPRSIFAFPKFPVLPWQNLPSNPPKAAVRYAQTGCWKGCPSGQSFPRLAERCEASLLWRETAPQPPNITA